MFLSGRTLRYEPEAWVKHCVPADRLTVSFFTKRHYAQGLSDQLLLALQGAPQGWRERGRLLYTLASVTKVLGTRLLRRRGRLDAWFEVAYRAGCVMGAFRAGKAHRGPEAAG